MLAASRMELDMVLDSRHSRLFSLGLHLGFAGAGRLQCGGKTAPTTIKPHI